MVTSAKKGRTTAPRLLLRGESVIASTGLALAAIFLLAIAAAGGWTVYTARYAARVETQAALEGSGRLLADSVQPLLSDEKWQRGVRSLMVSAVGAHGLSRCRIVLPDGRIIADAYPPKVMVHRDGILPTEGSEPAVQGEMITASFPVEVPGYGRADLQIGSGVTLSPWLGWRAQAGIGAVGVCGCAALLAVYRRLRNRLRAVGAIREALLAMKRGETATAALTISGKFGDEAGAWNGLLAERENLRKELATEKAKESLNSRADVKTDLAHACDALSQGLVLVDERMKIKYINGAAAVFLRGKREALQGAAIDAHVGDAEVVESVRAVASGGVRRRTSVEVRQAEGAGVLRYSIRPVRRDDSAAALIMIEDITQQRVADEARNSFVAQATHELRTPLTNIRLYVEQLIEAGEGDAAARAHALDVINQESRRLERIVGDMLSVSEIEAGSFKLRTNDVRLETLFEDIRGEYEAQAREKHLTLLLSLPPKLPVIQGDRDKIVLALHNLVGNAIKYTPEGGKVEVKVDVDGASLRVHVQDTGIGIKPEEADLVFEKFYRAKDPRVASITGTGLGLALAREVVRLHGGDITVRSQPDHGSTFTMVLPTHAEAA